MDSDIYYCCVLYIWTALWLRAAFHDAATYDPSKPDSIGGADGSLISMLDQPGHDGINQSIATHFSSSRIGSAITQPDQIVLAAMVTVGHCGGPNMTFEAGRKLNPNPIHPDGRVPVDTDSYSSIKARLRVMKMTDEDIVALVTGSHTLGYVGG